MTPLQLRNVCEASAELIDAFDAIVRRRFVSADGAAYDSRCVLATATNFLALQVVMQRGHLRDLGRPQAELDAQLEGTVAALRVEVEHIDRLLAEKQASENDIERARWKKLARDVNRRGHR